MKTLSEKQLAANRANAARSTGPRTPEGKSRAAANARKHGLAATSYTVTDFEDIDTLGRLVEDAVAHYAPENSQEQFAVERIALAQLAILHAYRLEAGVLTSVLDKGHSVVDGTPLNRQTYPPPDPTDPHGERNTIALGAGFHRLPNDKSFALLLRYQAQADRQYRRAVEDLQRLVSERPQDDFPNEPISDPQPDETKPEPAPAAEPVRRFLGSGLLRVAKPPCLDTPSPTDKPSGLLKWD